MHAERFVVVFPADDEKAEAVTCFCSVVGGKVAVGGRGSYAGMVGGFGGFGEGMKVIGQCHADLSFPR